MLLRKGFVATSDLDFFGIIVPKGTIYKSQKTNNDWFTPVIIENETPMTCPNYQLHFTVLINNDNFIEVYI